MALTLVWSCLSLNEEGEMGHILSMSRRPSGPWSQETCVWQGDPFRDTSPLRPGVALTYSVIFLASPSQTRGPCLLRLEESGGM